MSNYLVNFDHEANYDLPQNDNESEITLNRFILYFEKDDFLKNINFEYINSKMSEIPEKFTDSSNQIK